MHKISFTVILAASLSISACGSDESGSFETDNGDGSYSADRDGSDVNIQASSEDGEFSLSRGDDIDVEMPAGFTVYPGANVISNMTVDKGNDGGAVVTMESDASVEDLLSHYRAEAENAGIEIKAELNVRGMETLAGESAGGGSFTLRAGEGDNGNNSVTLMVGKDSD